MVMALNLIEFRVVCPKISFRIDVGMIVNCRLFRCIRCSCSVLFSQFNPKSRDVFTLVGASFNLNERKAFSEIPRDISKPFQVASDYLAMSDNGREQDNVAGVSSSTLETIRRTEWLHSEKDVPGDNALVTVMSYNVLAQDLIDENYHLYKYHEPEHLNWKHRQELLMEEFLQSEADILALQEVQESHINSFYKYLEDYGYKGYFKKRTNESKSDGCALYFKKDVFQLVSLERVEFQQPGIFILNRPNVAIIAKLRHKANGRILIIANTHLLYNPRKWEIRLAQMQVLLAEIHRVSSNCESPSLLLVGDLNSQPDSPIIKLIERGVYETEEEILPKTLGILPDCTHESKSKLYNSQFVASLFDGDETPSETLYNTVKKEAGQGACYTAQSEHEDSQCYMKVATETRLNHRLNFTSTYDFHDSSYHKEATTHQNSWVTVDYMFYSNMVLLARQRLPTVDDCITYIGRIPNNVSPSDHFPLLATYAL